MIFLEKVRFFGILIYYCKILNICIYYNYKIKVNKIKLILINYNKYIYIYFY